MPCPWGSLPFARSVVCLIGHSKFTLGSHPAYRGPLGAPSEFAWEGLWWQMPGDRRGLSSMAPPMLSCEGWKSKGGRWRLMSGVLKPSNQPTASPLPPAWSYTLTLIFKGLSTSTIEDAVKENYHDVFWILKPSLHRVQIDFLSH